MTPNEVNDHTLDQLRSVVEEFHRDSTAKLHQYRYLTLDGGPYTYVFEPKAGSHVVIDNITGESLARRIACQFVRIASSVPQLTPVLPRLGTIELTLPVKAPPNVLIGKQERVVLLNLTTEKVCKIPLDNPDSVTKELTVREQLPDSVPVPRLLEADYEYPYLIEEYIQGETYPMTLESLPFVCRALDRLKPLYRQDSNGVSTATLLKQDLQDETVRELREWLSVYDLPETVYESTIHRDLTPRNLSGTDRVYVLDWESARRDFVFVDMLQWLHAVADEQNTPELFTSLITQTGAGPETTAQLHDAVGTLAYDLDRFPSGLPLLYLFREYTNRQPKKRARLKPLIEQVTAKL